jgi:hypothetical protein
MISLSSFLVFFGCSKHPAPLDAKILDLTDSAEVASKAFASLVDAHAKGKNYEAYVASLPKHWRIIYAAISLDGEVMNGGFHQYFWNTEGRWNREAEESLETIGAEPFLKLFRDAKRIFDAHDYPAEKAKAGKSWDLFSVGYKEKRMGNLDTMYFEEKKSLPTFVGEYIKRNRALYEK